MRAQLLYAVLAVVLATGCGGSEESSADTAASDTATASSSSSAPSSANAPSANGGSAPRADEDNISIIKAKTKAGDEAAIAVKAPAGWTVLRAPSEPDPHGGRFTLAEALKGLDKVGTLSIHIDTSMGSIYCDLFEKQAPNTVANFVGLARGKRQFWDADKLAWVARPYYAGTTFHRVMPGFMIQGGDHTGTGNGGIGYTIADEIGDDEHADRPGLLFMATRGPGTGESQFFITTRPAPHIDGKFTRFGECSPVRLVDTISRVLSAGKPSFRPQTPVVIKGVEVRRLPGGRMKWIPKGTDLSVPVPVPQGRAIQIPLAPPGAGD